MRVLSEEVGESLSYISKNEEGEKVPYVVARGDGSVGGGGLAMPKASRQTNDEGESELDEALRRPKVGAEMPQG